MGASFETRVMEETFFAVQPHRQGNVSHGTGTKGVGGYYNNMCTCDVDVRERLPRTGRTSGQALLCACRTYVKDTGSQPLSVGTCALPGGTTSIESPPRNPAVEINGEHEQSLWLDHHALVMAAVNVLLAARCWWVDGQWMMTRKALLVAG